MATSLAQVERPRAALESAIATPRLIAFLAASLPVMALTAANGGFFPSSWGWASLAFAWAAALAIALRLRCSLGTLELVYLGSFAALVGWYLLSTLWSAAVPNSVFETERALVYPCAVGAVLLLVRRAALPQLVAGLLVGVFGIDLYALGTRLLPDRVGHYDPVATYRLAVPVGYWNGLGILSVMAGLLALALAVRGRSSVARALSAALLPVLLAVLYFTYSRGALIALGAALVAVVALDPRRLQLVTTSVLVLAPASIGIWLASRSAALTTQGASLASASHAGHRLALEVAGLALLSAVAALVCDQSERIMRPRRWLRLAYGATLVAMAVAAVTLGLAHLGGPTTAASRAWHAFSAPPAHVTGSLNKRLVSLSGSGRVDLWASAWDEARAYPLLGGGAGSYEEWWNAHRSTTLDVLDAHNLYLETLAELGPLGLALLVLALGVPLVAAVRTRKHRLVPFVAGAYVAYLVHAAADWDWELAGVTLAALFCGAALLIAGRTETNRIDLPWRFRLPALAVAVVVICTAVVVTVGNAELSSATNALQAGNWLKAESKARAASHWMPWSSEPWRAIGESQLARQQFANARRSLDKAIAKDPNNWHLWLDLASASKGKPRAHALDRARRLNPLSPDVASLG